MVDIRFCRIISEDRPRTPPPSRASTRMSLSGMVLRRAVLQGEVCKRDATGSGCQRTWAAIYKATSAPMWRMLERLAQRYAGVHGFIRGTLRQDVNAKFLANLG